jgi:hypothetical protein
MSQRIDYGSLPADQIIRNLLAGAGIEGINSPFRHDAELFGGSNNIRFFPDGLPD